MVRKASADRMDAVEPGLLGNPAFPALPCHGSVRDGDPEVLPNLLPVGFLANPAANGIPTLQFSPYSQGGNPFHQPLRHHQQLLPEAGIEADQGRFTGKVGMGQLHHSAGNHLVGNEWGHPPGLAPD